MWVLWVPFVVGEKTHVNLSSSIKTRQELVWEYKVKEWADVRPARLRIPGYEELGGGVLPPQKTCLPLLESSHQPRGWVMFRLVHLVLPSVLQG